MTIDATTVTGSIETRPLDDIRPYWRNPRIITEAAVSAVADSIRRYGYRNLITVDSEGIIINGHTRYAALRKLGVEEVAVIVAADLTEDQAREFRILDNKTGEFSEWDHEALIRELAEVEDEALLDAYFPELDLEFSDEGQAPEAPTPPPSVEDVDPVKRATVVDTTEVECPACAHTFDVKTSSL